MRTLLLGVLVIAFTTACTRRELAVPQTGHDSGNSPDASYADIGPDAGGVADLASIGSASSDLDVADLALVDVSTPDSSSPLDLSTAPDLAAACVMQPGSGTEATTDRLNPRHDGYQPDENISSPLFLRWTVDVGDGYVYPAPVIAAGRVFVTQNGRSQGEVPQVWAFARDTGDRIWGPIPIAMFNNFAVRVAADDERVIVLTASGAIQSLDATTGESQWSTNDTPQYSFTSSPVLDSGGLYLVGCGSGCTLYAHDASTGALRWSGLGNAEPTSADSTIFDNLGAGWSRAYDATSGSVTWTVTTEYSGGGGPPAIYQDGIIYVADGSGTVDIRNGVDGSSLGTLSYAPYTWPVFHGDHAYLRRFGDTSRYAVRLSTGLDEWSASDIDGPVVGANGQLFAISGSDLVAIDEVTGSRTWSTPLGTVPNDLDISVKDLVVADGVLLYPAGSTLSAYSGCP